MGRLLLILGLFFLFWIGYRFLKKTWSARVREIDSQKQQQRQAPQQEHPAQVQQIKACAYCKTHIPENEGVYKNGKFFCSYQHLDSYLEHEHNKQ